MKACMKKQGHLQRLVDSGRVAATKEGNTYVSGCDRWGNWKPLKLMKSELHNAYHVIRLTIDGRRLRYLTHRVVWTYFNGPIEDDSLQINHKDGNKSNNRLNNLELVFRDHKTS